MKFIERDLALLPENFQKEIKSERKKQWEQKRFLTEDVNVTMNSAIKRYNEYNRKDREQCCEAYNAIEENCFSALKSDKNCADAYYLLGLIYSEGYVSPIAARNRFLRAGQIFGREGYHACARNSFNRAFCMDDENCAKMYCEPQSVLAPPSKSRIPKYVKRIPLLILEPEVCAKEDLRRNYTNFASEFYKLYKVGQYDAASKKCSDAITADENNAKAYHCLGFACIALGDTKTAKENFFKAGINYYEQRYRQNAINSLELAVLYDPKFLDAYVGLEKIYRELDRRFDAEVCEEKFIDIIGGCESAVKNGYKEVYERYKADLYKSQPMGNLNCTDSENSSGQDNCTKLGYNQLKQQDKIQQTKEHAADKQRGNGVKMNAKSAKSNRKK